MTKTSLLLGCFSILLGISSTRGQKNEGPELGFTEILSQRLMLNASECVTFPILLPQSRFRVKIDASDFPVECAPNTTLRYTPHLLRQGECLEFYEGSSKCKVRLHSEDTLCDNLAVATELFQLDNQSDVHAVYKGWECVPVQYYLAFNSTCETLAPLNITVELANVTTLELETCRGPSEAEKKLFKLIIMILIGVTSLFGCLLVCTGVIGCCLCCPECCGGQKKSQGGGDGREDVYEVLIEPHNMPQGP